jgi:hypothetical protein
VNIASREVTYRTEVEQVFFEDGTELVVTIGMDTSGGGEIYIDYDWIDDKPEWAESLDIEALLLNREDN